MVDGNKKLNWLLFVLVMSFFSCNKKSKAKISDVVLLEKKVARADSINEEFLSRAVYDTALFYNNSPSSETEFLLNEKKLRFFYETLGNSFSEEEKLLPIPIKEITWNMDKKDFITVFYVEKINNLYL